MVSVAYCFDKNVIMNNAYYLSVCVCMCVCVSDFTLAIWGHPWYMYMHLISYKSIIH